MHDQAAAVAGDDRIRTQRSGSRLDEDQVHVRIGRMPIVFSHEIERLTPQFFWMGAGHAWIKMRCSFEDFKRTYDDKFLVLDITY